MIYQAITSIDAGNIDYEATTLGGLYDAIAAGIENQRSILPWGTPRGDVELPVFERVTVLFNNLVTYFSPETLAAFNDKVYRDNWEASPPDAFQLARMAECNE